MSGTKMVWEIVHATVDSPKLEGFLLDDYEPFAVLSRSASIGDVVYLRKLIEVSRNNGA